MNIIARISLYSLQILVLIITAMAVTGGLKYLATEEYEPTDQPPGIFQVVVVEPDETGTKKADYSVYQWDVLPGLKENTEKVPLFRIPVRAAAFQSNEGDHVTVSVLAEDQEKQIVEVKRTDGSDETVNRYQVADGEIFPLSFRRTSTGLAMRGFLVGFIMAGLAGIPLRKLLIMPS